ILPVGMIGLVIASLFSATMGMTSSDVNTIAAVITRDILPVVSKKFANDKNSLRTARVTTFVFTLATIVVALNYERFGGVLGLIVNWFGALLGPTALPLLFGLLPAFRSCGPKTAIASIAAGLLTFIVTKFISLDSLALEVGLPTIVSFTVYVAVGLTNKVVPEKVSSLMVALKKTTQQYNWK